MIFNVILIYDTYNYFDNVILSEEKSLVYETWFKLSYYYINSLFQELYFIAYTTTTLKKS